MAYLPRLPILIALGVWVLTLILRGQVEADWTNGLVGLSTLGLILTATSSIWYHRRGGQLRGQLDAALNRCLNCHQPLADHPDRTICKDCSQALRTPRRR